MVTSCYRRMGSFQKAMELYEEIHAKYPDNLECMLLAPMLCYPRAFMTLRCSHAGLRYLVAICKDLGHSYDVYQAKLVRLERSMAMGAGGTRATTLVAAAPQSSGDAPAPAPAYRPAAQSRAPGGDTEEKKAPASPGSPGVPLAAPAIAGRINGGNGAPAREDDDVFADAELDDLLAD